MTNGYDEMPATWEAFVAQCLAEYPRHVEQMGRMSIEKLLEERDMCEDQLDFDTESEITLCHLAWVNAELARRV